MGTTHNTHQLFNELYDSYVDVVYRLCLFKTSNKETAQDLSQEVFVRLYTHLEKNGIPDNSKAFIYQVARNIVIDHYRKHTSSSLDKLQEEGIEFEEGAIGHEATYNNAEHTIVMETLEGLDEKYREPLYMRLVEEMSVQDIAQVLGITESNVSVRISRGKEQMKLLLQT